MKKSATDEFKKFDDTETVFVVEEKPPDAR